MAIFVSYGVDPEVNIVSNAITSWRRYILPFATDPGQTWELAKDRVLRDGAARWQRSIGPWCGIFATLAGYQWDPVTPWEWIHPTAGSINPMQLTERQTVKAVGRTVKDKLWANAANHFCGSGLHSGPTEDTLRLFKKVRHRDASAAGTIECLLVGGFWPAARRSVEFGSSAVCFRCGFTPCDSRHMFWKCPGNDLLAANQAVADSEWLKPFANDDTLECFWLRGILPNHLIQPVHPIASIPHATPV